ncbi:response regulator transcription factor [Sphingobacterium corticibacterium]|uniref:Response regulator transcription factor n=1 Tax=Sphingobacterium corticibacterium TaxID=2484746 RepID=A0A4Q6XTA0_9SPHI|nr:response regulator [Sphingobacterium corticibacterium]RZF60009.1 response regulator transcription factor [Sphingobacterium corticibacterium]
MIDAIDRLHKPKILIVDDNIEVLDFLEDDLSDQFEITRASDGVEALEVLNLSLIDLIVCDVMMPKMDGFEVCKFIKSTPNHAHIPIILLTAKNTLNAKIEGLELGADAYIEKLFSPEYLRAQIHSLLLNRNKVKEFFISSPFVHVNTAAIQNSEESLFLEKLYEVIQQHMADPNLDVEKLADLMNLSRPTLYRKIKSISDVSPNELINMARLKKATALLLHHDYKIFEVSFLVGFSSHTHFGRNFQKYYGMSPREYIQEINNKKADTH